MIMPEQKFVDPVDFMLGNATEDIGEPSPGIYLVELRRLDEGIGRYSAPKEGCWESFASC